MTILLEYYSPVPTKDRVTDARASKPVAKLGQRGAFLLSQLGHHAASRCAELLAPLDLQPAHYGVLTHLTAAEGLSQQQLADLLGVHRNVMVGILDELEDRRLVRRVRDPKDRRAHQIHLTPHARDVLHRADITIDGFEEDMFACLTPHEHDQLVALLRRLADSADLPTGIHPRLRHRSRAPQRRLPPRPDVPGAEALSDD
jgi:DNA-binding MarR family transcriptional regulator